MCSRTQTSRVCPPNYLALLMEEILRYFEKLFLPGTWSLAAFAEACAGAQPANLLRMATPQLPDGSLGL